MKTIRQLTQKGDPRLNVKIPIQLKQLLIESGKCSRRRPQDEVIRRLVATFQHEQAFRAVQEALVDKLKSGY